MNNNPMKKIDYIIIILICIMTFVIPYGISAFVTYELPLKFGEWEEQGRFFYILWQFLWIVIGGAAILGYLIQVERI